MVLHPPTGVKGMSCVPLAGGHLWRTQPAMVDMHGTFGLWFQAAAGVTERLRSNHF